MQPDGWWRNKSWSLEIAAQRQFLEPAAGDDDLGVLNKLKVAAWLGCGAYGSLWDAGPPTPPTSTFGPAVSLAPLFVGT
jgi:hypothetical protein